MKKDFYQSHNIHPNTPKKLVTALHKVNWNRRALARQLDVNVFYINQLVTDGIEPTDATESGRVVRVKIFLKAYKPKPRVKAEPKPPRLPKWLNQDEPKALEFFVGQREKVKQMSKNTKHPEKDANEYLAVTRRRDP
jgi:hypothetical protein